MHIREADAGDAEGMGAVLRAIVAATGRERRSDIEFVRSQYLAYPSLIRCSVAVDDDGTIMGFQSLIAAEAENRYGVPDGWGIVGTHIDPQAHRRGVGRALFESTRMMALAVGLTNIDAYIAADNVAALRYYDAMGFHTYREPPGIVQKVFAVGSLR